MNLQDEQDKKVTLLENVIGLLMRKLGVDRIKTTLLEVAKAADSDSMDVTVGGDGVVLIRREPRVTSAASGLWIPAAGLDDLRDLDGAARK